MKPPPLALLTTPARYHFWGALFIVLFVSVVIGSQIANRSHFAATTLHREVAERWGAPIDQPVPSVRFVESGTVFNALEALPLEHQEVAVAATMNYRKRGLIYFSGFDFSFRGDYGIHNDRGKSIDLVLVFPIQMSKNQVLLSELSFEVNGEPTAIDLAEDQDKLLWTGRLEDGERLAFSIAYQGRGLDSFTYRLDPALPVRNFRFDVDVVGGNNFDYGPGVLPATVQEARDDRVSLSWSWDALESGVPVGVILPSEKAFDTIIATMIRRSWATFVIFFAALMALWVYFERRPRLYESYLVAAAYAFFFVLLPYFTAYMNFYLAYLLALTLVVALLYRYLCQVVDRRAGRLVLAALGACLALPTLAVIFRGYTGLIYTLEILAGLAVLMTLTTRPFFRQISDTLLSPSRGGSSDREEAHAT